MMQSHSVQLLALALSLPLALPPLALASERSIECASRHDRYQYCAVDTDGYVRLEHQLSRSPCVEDRTWGYDDSGIWVDEGCRARFTVGYGYDSDNNDNSDDDEIDGKDLATAAAVIGGIALLGTLLGDQDNTQQQPYPSSPPNYGSSPYPQPSYLPQTPAWAVGTFRGFDAFYNTQIELTISPEGSVSGYADGNPVSGSFQNNELRIRDLAFSVQPEGDGLSAIQVGNDNNRVRYHRVR